MSARNKRPATQPDPVRGADLYYFFAGAGVGLMVLFREGDNFGWVTGERDGRRTLAGSVLAVVTALSSRGAILRGGGFGGAIDGRGLAPEAGAWRAIPLMQWVYCVVQFCMQTEYDPGAEVA